MSDRTEEQRDQRRERGPADEEPRRADDEGGRLTTSDLVREADEVQVDEVRGDADETRSQPLLANDDAEGFRSQWLDIQAAFVDEPRRAVHEADELVAELMQRLARTFADERATLESQWDRDEDVSTEDLRIALQRYRSFFDRLLSA